MRIFHSLSSILVLAIATTGFHGSAIAQPKPSTQPKAQPTLAESFERAFFANDPAFYRNRSWGRQLDLLFGFKGFIEREINRDAASVHNLYQSSLKQQNSRVPAIRTRDLPNPYETSILTSPKIDVNQKVQNNEVIFDNQQSQ
ncbi:MAG TPA: hypothetical protein DEV81_17170 [Cyanobacteria bacterium UBA11049]|nr:hypothetical protein [Cyanobacteria bacterium UBA11049]